ncbi:Trm112 family protein [Oerskovia turbata]
MSDDTTTRPDGPATLDPWVREALRCPVTGAALVDGTGPDGNPELHSTDPDRPLAYPIQDGIPVLLAGSAREL